MDAVTLAIGLLVVTGAIGPVVWLVQDYRNFNAQRRARMASRLFYPPSHPCQCGQPVALCPTNCRERIRE